MIEAYSFGSMRIGDAEHRKDLIVFAPGVRGPEEEVQARWWRAEGHSVALSDLTFLPEVRPRVLVIGQGAYGRMAVPEETIAELEALGIEAVVCPTTGEGVELYNRLAGSGVSVAGAFHLTC